MIQSLISKIKNNTRPKIHPEQSFVTKCSGPVPIDGDPCSAIYMKYKEIGAYEQFSRSLKTTQ